LLFFQFKFANVLILHFNFSDGKNNNIPAGTVVDKDIIHPFQYQFFLASHAAIQGVTKPSKYCVLVNESKISPDDLQAVTYGKFSTNKMEK
jgi:Piwi domain